MSPAAVDKGLSAPVGSRWSGIANITGAANMWLNLTGTPPCDWIGAPPCQAAKLPIQPHASFAVGASFGFNKMTAPTTAPNHFNVSVSPAGGVLATSVVGTLMGLADTATSYGAPWTTGMITVSVTTNPLGPQVFMLTGSDARVNGVGAISLVSGGVVQRSLSGPSSNQGWLNLTVPEPTASLGFVASLASLVLVHAVFRRRASQA